ncbi:hypothetical protein RND81_13G076500 [Saponaria officinalis]|uniref:Uncharacterized protein n=1 Tax=Saponaria officinalis TaxID=3572 RepID=A0AAW1GV50_SAPOF
MGKMREIMKKKRLMAIVLGQFLSLVITSTGFTSSELARKVAFYVHLCFYVKGFF